MTKIEWCQNADGTRSGRLLDGLEWNGMPEGPNHA